jgi:hypothetical protein
MGSASRQIADAWGVSAFAEGMSGAVAEALRNPVSKFSLLDKICIVSMVHGFRGRTVNDVEAKK